MLSQAQIRGYFSRCAASLKRGAVDASLRGDDAADDAADDADEGGGENDDAYESFKVAELQHILRARELAVSGPEGGADHSPPRRRHRRGPRAKN